MKHGAGVEPTACQPDPANWRTRLDDATIARYRGSGEWSGVTIGTRLRDLAARAPNRLLFIDDTGVLTVSEALSSSLRLASAIRALGLRRGDVVSFQLPNWREAALVELACALGGFVCNPIVPIYRDAEVGFILADAATKLLFVPTHFRGYNYRAMAQRLGATLPGMHVAFVRGARCELQQMIAATEDEALSTAAPDGAHVKLILYTSGTTSTPKGVLHTHDTIDAEVRTFADHLQLDDRDVILMPSTVGHITGYLYGIQLPVTLGACAVLMETWDAAAAADLIERHRVTFTIGATPFLQELVQVAADQARPLPSLRLFPCGGAPVPPSIVRDAERIFANCRAFRIFGSTEAPTVTLGTLDASDADARAETEGVVAGHDVRLLNLDGVPVQPGEEGEIVVRGPEVCVGYADWAQNSAFDADGFFHTGDLGRFDSGARLIITGRLKDIIIRGGENISAKELEDLLHTHPAIREAAVVAMPHPRLGETACACVTLQPGQTFDPPAMQALLAQHGLARQKWPEQLEILDTMPITPSGKVRKNVLRDRVRDHPLFDRPTTSTCITLSAQS